MNQPSSLMSSVAIVLGLGIGGYFIGAGIEKFGTANRAISVKGFSEREEKSDIAF